jgi:hypothetical protein
MKTLADLISGETITPGEVYEIAAANMDPEHIGHYESDLYLKVNSASSIIVSALDNRALLNTFRSNIDGALWYELPFCYIPGWTRDPWEA